MGRNLFEGWHIVVLLVVVLLVFGASRLPQVAKSLGQSMKIFKREVKELREDSTSAEDEKPAAKPTSNDTPPQA